MQDQRFRFAATAAGAAGDLFIFGGQQPLSRISGSSTPAHNVINTIEVLKHRPVGTGVSAGVGTANMDNGDDGGDDDDDDDDDDGWAPAVGVVLLVATTGLAVLLLVRERKWRAATKELRSGLSNEIELADVKLGAHDFRVSDADKP